MPSTIVDRILAEYSTRKSTKDTILRQRRGSKRVREEPRRAGPGREEPASLVSRFKEELVPVIGRAVSTEVAEALEKVRKDLIECLERQLSRFHTPVPLAVQERLAERTDSMETDLDLPADEVNRQLNRVFADMDPSGEGAPFAKTVILPTIDRLPHKDDQPLNDPSGVPPIPPEFEPLPELPISESPPAEGLRGSDLSRPVPTIEAWTEPRSEQNPASPPSPEPAAPLRSAPDLLLLDGDPSIGPIAAQVVKEVRETLIPGIADGISNIFGHLEQGQERISREIALISERVAGLETLSSKLRGGSGLDAPAGQSACGPTSPGPKQAAAQPGRSEASPALSPPVPSAGPREASPAPVQGSGVLAPVQEAAATSKGGLAVILLELREMEKRLLKKIDSLRARKKKAPPAAAPIGHSDNLH